MLVCTQRFVSEKIFDFEIENNTRSFLLPFHSAIFSPYNTEVMSFPMRTDSVSSVDFGIYVIIYVDLCTNTRNNVLFLCFLFKYMKWCGNITNIYQAKKFFSAPEMCLYFVKYATYTVIKMKCLKNFFLELLRILFSLLRAKMLRFGMQSSSNSNWMLLTCSLKQIVAYSWLSDFDKCLWESVRFLILEDSGCDYELFW